MWEFAQKTSILKFTRVLEPALCRNLPVCIPFCLPARPPIRLPTFLPTCLPTLLPTQLPICLPTWLSTCLHACQSACLLSHPVSRKSLCRGKGVVIFVCVCICVWEGCIATSNLMPIFLFVISQYADQFTQADKSRGHSTLTQTNRNRFVPVCRCFWHSPWKVKTFLYFRLHKNLHLLSFSTVN